MGGVGKIDSDLSKLSARGFFAMEGSVVSVISTASTEGLGGCSSFSLAVANVSPVWGSSRIVASTCSSAPGDGSRVALGDSGEAVEKRVSSAGCWDAGPPSPGVANLGRESRKEMHMELIITSAWEGLIAPHLHEARHLKLC